MRIQVLILGFNFTGGLKRVTLDSFNGNWQTCGPQLGFQIPNVSGILDFFILITQIPDSISKNLPDSGSHITIEEATFLHFQEFEVKGKYSQLSPCGHPSITNTPIIRTTAKFPAKTNYRRYTEIKSRYYGLSLMRTLTRGFYIVRSKGSGL